MLGVATHPQRKETAVLDTLSRSGGQLQSILGAGGTGGAVAAGEAAGLVPRLPDRAQVAAAVARYQW
jgi:hypothetical protein